MSLPGFISRVLEDPPPAHVFELSEAGVAYSTKKGEIQFRQFEPGVLSVSPARDNVLRPEVFAAGIASLTHGSTKGKRRPAAVILPDHSARVQVLDFDSFPTNPEDQGGLVRFRVKKTVPFDIDSAAVSYHLQPSTNNKKKVEVVAAVMSLDIIARYEAAFRSAGFAPGLVTTSAVAALNLMPAAGINILVKLSAKVLSVLAADGTRLKMVRTVELDQVDSEEILAVLHPTLAYLEDEMAAKVDRIYLCGFGPNQQQDLDLGIPIEPLHSRRGAPNQYNAGLLGYLESAGGLQ
jgi:type IV pilus assembly protein PilM